MAGSCTRRASFTRGRRWITACTPASVVLPMPPLSWMVSTVGASSLAPAPPSCTRWRLATSSRACTISHPNPMRMYAATFGWLANPASVLFELAVVRPLVLVPASLLVNDGDDAVHVREILQYPARLDPLGDVLAGAGRAVHRADDGDVIPRAVPPVGRPVRAAVEPHEAQVVGRRGERGGQVRAEGVVPRERLRLHVLHVDVFADGNRPGREPDHLPELEYRVPLLDRPDGELVPHLHPARHGHGAAVEVEGGAGGDAAGGDGDVVGRAEVDGVLAERDGRHRGNLRGEDTDMVSAGTGWRTARCQPAGGFWKSNHRPADAGPFAFHRTKNTAGVRSRARSGATWASPNRALNTPWWRVSG